MFIKKFTLLVLLFLFITPFVYSQEEFTMKITTQEWEPYNFRMEDNSIGGIATEIVKKVLDDMNVNYEIDIYPWARAQALVEAGKADAFYVASKNISRDIYAVISDPIAPQKWYWYLKKDNVLNPMDPEFINQARVVSLFGSNMYYYLKDNNYKIPGNAYTMDNLVKMLDSGMVDAILMNDLVLAEYFKNNEIDYEVYNKFLCKNKPLGMYFSKKFLKEHREFLEEFNETLKKYVVDK